MILALPIVVRIVAVAPLMALADRGIGPRRLITGACCAVALVYVALLRAEGFVLLGALVVLMALAHAPIIPAADLVTIQAIRRDRRLDYGRIRLWGSIAFLAASIGGGYILGALPADAVIWLLLGLAVTAMATAWLVVPDGMAANADPDAPRPAGGREHLPLSLWYVIGAAACTQASHAALYAFGSIHWRDLGFSSATIGWLWAVGVVAEILVFAALGKSVGRGTAAFGLILAGAGTAALRFAALAADPGLPATFALQMLHGLTFGATHLGAMAALALLAPEAARGRAQGVMSVSPSARHGGRHGCERLRSSGRPGRPCSWRWCRSPPPASSSRCSHCEAFGLSPTEPATAGERCCRRSAARSRDRGRGAAGRRGRRSGPAAQGAAPAPCASEVPTMQPIMSAKPSRSASPASASASVRPPVLSSLTLTAS